MTQESMRLALLESTVRTIARDGLDKATTRAIAKDANLNEAYIYRLFNDKDDLFAKAFAELDNELVTKAMKQIAVMYMNKLDFEVRSKLFFTAMWKFLLGNKEKCMAFIRYYYSPYFKKYSLEEHKHRFKPLVERFEDAFKPESNTWMILNHILNVMLDFAVKVFDNEVPDNDNTAKHIFILVYSSVMPYRKC